MKREHREIAAYLSTLNRTQARYRRARVQEFTCEPLNVMLSVPKWWPSNHSRVLAYYLACAALGTNKPWGDSL